MYAASQSYASSTYSNVAIDTGVASADAHGLITMLLDGAINRAGAARVALDKQDYVTAAQKLGDVGAIVAELRACLDHEQGGELATNLERLYDYIQRRLLHANRHRDPAVVLEVMELLAQVHSAWLEIA